MRPSKLINILAVPGTDEPLSLIVTGYAGDEPYSGWVEDNQGRVWGRLDSFRFRFVGYEPVTTAEREALRAGGPREIVTAESNFFGPNDPAMRWSGPTLHVDDYLKGFNGTEKECVLSFASSSSLLEILFHAHGWSGRANVDVDGEHFAEIDLFNMENGIVRRLQIGNPGRQARTIQIRPSGTRHQDAQGQQVLLEGIIEYGDELRTPVYAKTEARNRGGAFRSRFFEIAQTLSDDAVILDAGGGRRQLADDRYLNLEYSFFEEPDIFGDGTALPFRTGSIDFVYTAAVLEHVRNPLAMGAEIHRVLKHGSIVLANSAFMQPVHSEGQHFFNLTPYGIELTFEKFRNKKIWWETSFDSTMSWIVNLAQLTGKVEPDRLDTFLDLAKEISDKISQDRGMYFASGVWLEAVK